MKQPGFNGKLTPKVLHFGLSALSLLVPHQNDESDQLAGVY